MKRVIGLGLGVAWAASAGAADPKPLPVLPPAVTPAALPPGLRYADQPTGITAVAANQPVAPTVAAPYPAADAAPVPAATPAPVPVVEAAPPVTGQGCAGGCEPAARGHRAFGGKLVGWLCYRPGPAVLPRFVPNYYETPLLAYFPTHPLPPCPPDVINIQVGGPSIIPRWASPTGIAPVIAAPAEVAPPPAAAPATKPADPPAAEPDPKRTTRSGWGVFPPAAPRVVPAGNVESKPGPVMRLLDFIDPAKPAGSPNISLKEVISGPTLPATPPAPPVARGQVYDAPPPAPGCPTCAGGDPLELLAVTRLFAKCERHALRAPCTGHGDLSGYRFAEPTVHPCPPLLPLRVKDCSAGFGPGGCAGGDAPGPVPAEFAAAKAKPTAAPAKKPDNVLAAAKPFTNP
jgi:hypothetical protein